MLNNIKMLLGIPTADTSKDAVINYWIDFYTKMVLKYCHITELNDDLSAIIEQIVIEKMGGIGSQGSTATITPHPATVKSITRGDYSVTYEDSIASKQTTMILDTVAIGFQGQLNLYRRLDY